MPKRVVLLAVWVLISVWQAPAALVVLGSLESSRTLDTGLYHAWVDLGYPGRGW